MATPAGSPVELPPGTEVSVLLAEDVGMENEEADVEDGCRLGAWYVGKVAKSKMRKSGQDDEGSDQLGCVRHLVQFQDGSQQWVNFTRRPVLVHPPQDGDGGLSRADRARIMTLHFDGWEAASASSGKKQQPSGKQQLGSVSQQCFWLTKVKDGSLSEMAELVLASCASFDFKNISAVLSRFARDCPFAAGDAAVSWSAISECIKRVHADSLCDYTPRSIANICWAAARLAGAEDRGGGLDEDAQKALPGIYHLAMCRLLADLRWATTADEDVWPSGDIWAGWQPQEVANLCWAITRSGNVPMDSVKRRLLSIVAQGALLSRWAGFAALEMANAFSAIGASGLAPPILVKRILYKTHKHLDMFKPQEVSVVLLTAAKSWAPRALYRPVLQSVLQKVAKTKLEGYNSLDMQNLMFVMAAVSKSKVADELVLDKKLIHECAGFVVQVCGHATSSIRSWKAGELTGLVFGLSKLGLLDEALLREVGRLWRTWLQGDEQKAPPDALSPQTLANLVLAMTRLGYADPELVALVCGRAGGAAKGVARKGSKTWDEKEMTNVLWAGACALGCHEVSALRGPSSQPRVVTSALKDLASALQGLLKTVCSQVQQGRLKLREGLPLSMLHIAYTALRAWRAECGTAGGCEAWEPPQEMIAAWRRGATNNVEGLSKRELQASSSRLHKEVSRSLTEQVLPSLFPGGYRKSDEVDLGGFIVDILITPTAGPRLSIEVNGPPHYVQLVPSLSSAASAAESAPVHRLNGKSRMKMWFLQQLEGVVPIAVPYFGWDACQSNPARQATFLLEVLREAGVSAGAASQVAPPTDVGAAAQGAAKNAGGREETVAECFQKLQAARRASNEAQVVLAKANKEVSRLQELVLQAKRAKERAEEEATEKAKGLAEAQQAHDGQRPDDGGGELDTLRSAKRMKSSNGSAT